MAERNWLAGQFEDNRIHLKAVAYRILGSTSDADDAVQEAWLRLTRSDPSAVENLRGWLTTIVARVCLDMLRSRVSRREEPLDEHVPDLDGSSRDGTDPEHEALLGDSIRLALLVVLERLAPAERVAFVLHDLFAVPFDEIAPIVRRSPAATRQLASRARRRVQNATVDDAGIARQRQVVDAFLTASRRGDLTALVAVLDPDVVLRADHAAVQMGASPEARGAKAVADTFSKRARAARPALVNGAVGLVWSSDGEPRVVFDVRITNGKIVRIDLVADTEAIRHLDLADLD
jgi:RNA polymerase sigma factor (sigma-70 family)